MQQSTLSLYGTVTRPGRSNRNPREREICIIALPIALFTGDCATRTLWFRTRRKFCKAFDGNLAQSRLKWRILTSISTQRVAHLLPVGCAAIWMSKSQCQQWLHRIVYLQSSDIFPGQVNVEKLRLKHHKRNKKLREKRRKESKSVKLDRVKS